MSGNGHDGVAGNITESSFWGTKQDGYHYNIVNGFRVSGSVKIPALADGSNAADGNIITNPSGDWHNNAETKIKLPPAPALIIADIDDFWFDSGDNAKAIGYSDLVANTGDYSFADISTANQYKNILLFSEALAGWDLNAAKLFTNITT